MKKFIAAIALLVAASAHAYHLRTLTGTFINAAGGAAVTTGYLLVTGIGAMPATIPDGVLVPLPPYSFPIVSGVLTCTSACAIVSPANYHWQVFETTSTGDIQRWAFDAGVPDASADITVQEIYIAKYGAPAPPAISDHSPGPRGPVGPAGTNVIWNDNPALDAYSGITETGIAGEALSQSEIVYRLASDAKWYKARADAEATSGPVEIGMATVAVLSGATATVLRQGYIARTSWGLTAGLYYLSESASGAMQTTATTTSNHVGRVLGWARTTTLMYFDPSKDWIVK